MKFWKSRGFVCVVWVVGAYERSEKKQVFWVFSLK